MGRGTMTPPLAPDRYWFARRFPVGHPRSAVAPVSPEGRRVFYVFAGTMLAGALAWGLMSLAALYFSGVFVFVAATIYAVRRLFKQVAERTDHQHTIEDYKSGRVPV